MAGGYEITPADLVKAEKDVNDTNQQVTGLLSSLKSQLEPLATMWAGDASRAFATLMEQWNQDTAKLNQALAEIAEQLGASGKTYSANDESASSSFGSIAGSTGGIGDRL